MGRRPILRKQKTSPARWRAWTLATTTTRTCATWLLCGDFLRGEKRHEGSKMRFLSFRIFKYSALLASIEVNFIKIRHLVKC
jgi:hypothetical protein